MPSKPTSNDPGAAEDARVVSNTVLMPPALSPAAAPAPASIPYHCVCGAIVDLSPDQGGQCRHCGRRYSARVARVAATETLRMPLPTEEELAVEVTTDPQSDADPLTEPPCQGTAGAPHGEAAGQCVLPADRKLGHFRLVGRLGRGGMGDVFRALDESLQRYVAIKLLRPIGPDDDARADAVARLLEEARAQARVNHPGVVHIYFVSPDPERPFLAMELVSGGSLGDRMRSGPMPYDETVEVALSVASALGHAARFDVVHGDIKPGNILISEDGQVKLGDFGLARRRSARRQAAESGLTGTPNYLAPEITWGAVPDHRGDMYALGVMFFEMTFGRRPYSVDSGSIRDALEAHRSAPVEFPETWPLDLPEGWRLVLERLLSKDPADRYGDYEELIADLQTLQPIELPTAGRVSRGLAWGVDLFLAGTAMTLLTAPYEFLVSQGIVADFRPAQVLWSASAVAIVIVVAAWLQSIWKTSPGKAIFQLRVVDRHGLTPGEGPLAFRAFCQLLPTCVGDVFAMFAMLGAVNLGWLAGGAVLAVSAIDAAFAILRLDGRSAHDLLFMTRVALDVRSGENAS